ncbi:MAG: hypothetical protein HY336_02635 [Candidatus Doudnabacteria bacterium]|nr:hypothetical protein [Candidatus Doudnabacteria bacterium]
MEYRIWNIEWLRPNSKFQIPHSQKGVTLLIALLVMSGITLITLSVGYFAIQEIRSTRAVILTEPAIGAAETGGEQGVWAIKRSASLTDCASGKTGGNLGNSSRVETCKYYGAATIGLAANTNYSFYLYDPNDINGDIDLSNYPYNYLSVAHKSGGFGVTVTVARITGASVGNGSASPGSTETISIQPVASGSEGRMKVTLFSFGDATVEVNTNQGIPDRPTVDSSGCSGTGADCSSVEDNYKRRINVTVPQ